MLKKNIVESITNLYWELLFRKPDDVGLQYWYDEINNNRITFEELRSSIINCKERNSINKKIKSFDIIFF
jgi:hypothetical protein